MSMSGSEWTRDTIENGAIKFVYELQREVKRMKYNLKKTCLVEIRGMYISKSQALDKNKYSIRTKHICTYVDVQMLYMTLPYKAL